MRLFCAILLFSALSSPAGTYYFRLDGDDAADGSSWVNAKSNLQGFVLSQTDGGNEIYAGAGDWQMTNDALRVAKNTTLRGAASNETALVGAGTNVVRARGTNVWLIGLTITGGNSSSGGAGVRGYGSSFAALIGLSNCVVVSNVYTWAGGGEAGGGVCWAKVYNSVIDSCLTTNTDNGPGGGAYNSYLYDSTIQNCSAKSASGGGMHGGAAYRSIIRSNYAQLFGGGQALAHAVDCLISSNCASGGGGGAYYGTGSNNVYEWNIAPSDGAGVKDSVLTNAVIRYNSATGAASSGGGAYGNNARLHGCQIVSNRARYGGGVAGGGRAYGCLIAGNFGYDGGAGTDSRFYDCVLDGNSAALNPAGRESYAVNGCTVVNHTNPSTYLMTGGGAAQVYNTIIYNNVSNRLQSTNVQAIYTNDPSFLEGSYKISSGSPCVDAGNNTYATTALDFYGRDRVVDGGSGTATVDIGAAEYQSGIDDPVSSSRKKLFLPLLFE